ncbi:hypothetical protein CERSUDRAFT_100853 [Gelatoporia subvermispora B]|uniref:MaoC-like domain-containing protein n=1 Tax=Ceriporiopsis subvermispora (strain B) TaxID=914234 RepID=M2QYF6_CERS8|nr:hypothetical protein CERSUDRAFT_100853 [Gelatoporia subvermispora B]
MPGRTSLVTGPLRSAVLNQYSAGFLFASRVIVAMEAHTSSSAKDLVVAMKDVGDSQWESAYQKDTGGTIAVRLELGEPIQMSANRSAATNESYSGLSGAFDLIHTNPYFSDSACFLGTITHGMWRSAATKHYLETISLKDALVVFHGATLFRSVLLGDKLNIKTSYIGMRDANTPMKVETINDRGEKVLKGTAEVAQSTAVCVLTSQGPKESGMGSVKDLVGGKSALQDESPGDMQLEFSAAPDKDEELPLEELGPAHGVGFFGSLVIDDQFIPVGDLGLGSSRTDGVLLLTVKFAKRLWFGNRAEAMRSGISLSAGGAGDGSGGASGGLTADSEELLKFKTDHEQFAAR